MSSARAATRSQHYHGGPKGKLTGNSVQPAPAWRPRNMPAESRDPGSKILLSNLPVDVSEVEIVDLMKKTIGPVDMRESFIIYTAKGFPRGMAIVAFTRAADAQKARIRYNGKVIDGKRAIRLEVILDRDVDAPSNTPKVPQQTHKSLFDRLGPTSLSMARNTYYPVNIMNGVPMKPMNTKHQPRLIERTAMNALLPLAPGRKRRKKGPKRVKKSVADLDREMEEYAAGRVNGGSGTTEAV